MTQAQVGIVMGSQSDWPTMRHAAEILDTLGVAHEVKIVSAHRTPDRMFAYAEAAAGSGLRMGNASAFCFRLFLSQVDLDSSSISQIHK